MFSAIDIAAIVILAVGVFSGMRRKLSGELAQLVSMAVAFVVGIFSYRPVGAWLEETGWFGLRGGQAVAFLGAVVAAAMVMVIVRATLRKILASAITEETDRTAGGVAGLVRAAIFVLIVFLVMNLIPNDYLNRQFGRESAIGRVVQVFVPAIQEKYGDFDPEKLEQIKNGTESIQEDTGGDPVPVRRR